MEKKQRVRFSSEEDIAVPREVVYYNPYRDNKQWDIIRQKMISSTRRDFTIRGIKDRIDYEIKEWNKKK